jgi:hypothetical protein
VASPVGPARSIAVPGQTGFLAESIDEWIEALTALARDRAQARAQGRAWRRGSGRKQRIH